MLKLVSERLRKLLMNIVVWLIISNILVGLLLVGFTGLYFLRRLIQWLINTY